MYVVIVWIIIHSIATILIAISQLLMLRIIKHLIGEKDDWKRVIKKIPGIIWTARKENNIYRRTGFNIRIFKVGK